LIRAAVFDRRHDYALRRAAPQSRRDLEIVVGDVVDFDQLATCGGLPDQRLYAFEGLRARFVFAAETVGGGPAQRAGFIADIERRHHHAEILGKKFKHRTAELRQGRLPGRAFRQQALAGAQPRLLFQRFSVLSLRPQGAIVGRRQVRQFAPAEHGEQ
jgi:hypothetical protein